MVEFTPELVAILCYTAFALFLSLYYVPFRIVPKAWAKAVKTKGHPAQVALSSILDEAGKNIAESVKVPTAAAIVEELGLPDFGELFEPEEYTDNEGKTQTAPRLLLELARLQNQANAVAGAAMVEMKDESGAAVQVPIGQALPVLINQAASNARKGGQMRGDGAGGATTAIEGFLGDVEWAAENPEQATALAAAHQVIDSLGPMFNKTPAQMKQLHAQANEARGTVEGLKTLMDKLQALANRTGGGQQSAGGGSPAASRGNHGGAVF